jgi:GT2 family glycosyltransferase
VLFLIDDDSFMYHTCAEEVMKIYEADVRRLVAGVGPAEVWQPPSPELLDYAGPQYRKYREMRRTQTSLSQKLRSLMEKELDVERLLLPYDRDYPDHPVPHELAEAPVARARYLSGFRMTFRAEIIRAVGFDETLTRYASAEDLDASYRASRHGVLLHAFNAHIFHAQAAQARLSRRTRTQLGILNLAYLYRRKGFDPVRLLAAFRRRVIRRLAVDIIRDLGRKRFWLPCARGDLEALIGLRKIRQTSNEKLIDWYAALQKQIIERNAA